MRLGDATWLIDLIENVKVGVSDQNLSPFRVSDVTQTTNFHQAYEY